MTKYRCTFVGDCDRATRGEVFELEPGADLKCPGCTMQLQIDPSEETATGGTRNKTPLMIAAALAVVLMAGGGWAVFGKRAPETAGAQVATPPTGAMGASAATAAEPVKNAGSAAPIGPAEHTVQAQKQDAQDGLKSGDNSRAADASTKAASNELVKLGIANLAQGKMDDAERSFKQALQIDAKQSLAYYNMAVLRLRQGRIDEALQEFETSFKNGFQHFDKLEEDRDLDGIRKDSRFVALIARHRAGAERK